MKTIHHSAMSKLVLFHQVVQIQYRVVFMFTRSTEQSSCSQSTEQCSHSQSIWSKCSCSQKIWNIQLMFMIRSSTLYNLSCLQTELLEYVYNVHKQQYKEIFMFTRHSLLVRDRIIQYSRTQMQLFYVSEMHLYWPFSQMCIQQSKEKNQLVLQRLRFDWLMLCKATIYHRDQFLSWFCGILLQI